MFDLTKLFWWFGAVCAVVGWATIEALIWIFQHITVGWQ